MRKIFNSMTLVVLSTVALLMTVPAFSADAASAPAGHYSVETTTVGTLLDDPAAVEILKMMIPTVYGNEMFQTMGRELTLKAIQQFESEALSDANLAKIQTALDKIPAKG